MNRVTQYSNYELRIKYASSFWSIPDAAESTPEFGDRKTYQMDPANRRGHCELDSDLAEGRYDDCKPALSF